MVTLEKLEKERIEKIKSLDKSQLENYVDVLVKELSDLHNYDLDSLTNPDGRLAEISDVYMKLKEIEELNIGKFNNIKNYIKGKVNNDLLVVNTVKEVKYLVKIANMKNALIGSFIKKLFDTFYIYSQFLILILNDSSTADDKVAEIKDKIFGKLINNLTDDFERIDKLFYSDDVLIKDIADAKDRLDVIRESDDDLNVALGKYGIVDAYSGLLNAYLLQLEMKRFYLEGKSVIVDLIDNIKKLRKLLKKKDRI